MRRRRKYRSIISQISSLQIAQPDNLDQFSDDDLFTDLISGRGTSLFLGQYSGRGIIFILDRLGILSSLRNLGLDNISVDIDTSRPFQHFFRLYHNKEGQQYLIAEIIIKRGTFALSEKIPTKDIRKSYNIFIVEWLLLQNPLGQFTTEKPQLPGQEHPGIGLSSEAFEILYWIARRGTADGVMIIPKYLYSAIIYSRDFRFVDPRLQAMLTKIRQNLLGSWGLAQVSWACEERKIVNQVDGATLKWSPFEMILPASRRMHDYFHSRYYRTRVRRHKTDFHFEIEQGYSKKFAADWSAAS